MEETLGKRVKKRRIDLGLTQEELAKRMGYASRASVNKVETDERSLSLDLVAKYAVALDCDPSYLAGWQIEVKRPDTDAMLKRLSAYLDRMENLNADKMQ